MPNRNIFPSGACEHQHRSRALPRESIGVRQFRCSPLAKIRESLAVIPAVFQLFFPDCLHANCSIISQFEVKCLDCGRSSLFGCGVLASLWRYRRAS